MIAWLKAVHISAFAIWCAGLIVLPTLYAQQSRAHSHAASYLVHRFTRSIFIEVASPAAFIAIASGTALIFARSVFVDWMLLKLAAVGLLVILHVWSGHMIIQVFESRRGYSRIRQILATLATLIVVTAILGLVLAKPPLELRSLPTWLAPGGLQSLVKIINPTP
jgi:uncharacterized membrane protein